MDNSMNSEQVLTGIDNETMRNELEALLAIYGDEVQIISPTESIAYHRIEVKVKASQKIDENNTSWLRNLLAVRLIFTIDSLTYPEKVPNFQVKRLCGVADEELETMRAQMKSIQGDPDQPILFDFIQIAQEFLDAVSLTDLVCAICLSDFSDESDVALTSCGHIFHRICIGRHLHFHEENVAEQIKDLPPMMEPDSEVLKPYCPACRSSIEGEFEPLSSQAENTIAFLKSAEEPDLASWRNKQKELRQIFEKQLAKGGIIDLEKEQKKNLVTENTFVPVPKVEAENSTEAVEESEKKEESKKFPHHSKYWRGKPNSLHTRGSHRARGRSKPHSSHSRDYKPPNNSHGPRNDSYRTHEFASKPHGSHNDSYRTNESASRPHGSHNDSYRTHEFTSRPPTKSTEFHHHQSSRRGSSGLHYWKPPRSRGNGRKPAASAGTWNLSNQMEALSVQPQGQKSEKSSFENSVPSTVEKL